MLRCVRPESSCYCQIALLRLPACPVGGGGLVQRINLGMVAFHNVEAKYPYPIARRNHLYHAIAAVCLRDGRFAEDDVNSVYFDTPSWELLSQKESSDYLKTKVRVRWYGRSVHANPEGEVPAFVERKSKTGTLRNKPRIKIKLPAGLLREGEEDLEGVARLVTGPLGEIASDLGPLFPMVVIRYRRARFVEPLTSARLSLDSRIRFTGLNTRFVPPAAPRTLVNGVLEVKNADGRLPLPLLAARYFLFARDSFSKYEECWRARENPHYQRNFRWTHFEK